MHRSRSLAVSLVGSLLLTACADLSTTPSPASVPPSPTDAPSGPRGSRIVETPVLVRYDLDVDVKGALRPGQPFEVVVSTTNTLDDRSARIELLLPEAAVARRNGWTDGKAKPGSRLQPDFSAVRALSHQRPATSRSSFVIGAPGLYRLNVRVSSAEDAPGKWAGNYVQDVSARTLWLLVDASGGKVLDRFDPAVIPAKFVREPGPSRMMMPIDSCPIDDPTSCEPVDPYPPPVNTQRSTYEVVVTYNNTADSGSAAEPLRNAQITVADYPSGLSYSGQTDEAGRFYPRCVANGYSQQHIVVRLLTPDQFHIQDHAEDRTGMVVVDVVEPAGFCAAGTGTQIAVSATEDGPAWMHQQMLATVAPSRSLFQLGRGDVAVNYDRTNFELTSAYYPWLDEIFIKGSHMYGRYGRFVMSHEYGHALAEKSMGGARAGGCPSVHYLDGGHSMMCALSEGWADYLAALVRGPVIGSYYTDIRNNGYYRGGDGSIVEGAFASFLFSMTTTETLFRFGSAGVIDYALHYPPSFVAASIRDCRTWYPRSPVRSGVTNYSDEVVWCLSGGIDQSVYGTYFTSRPFQDPFSSSYLLTVSNSTPYPANHSTANVRRNWLGYLYGQY